MALSGGGFRASVFHLGVFRKLAELGWLPKVDVISTVSGGSILGAFAVLRWTEMLNAGADWPAFNRHIAEPFLDLITGSNFIRDWAVRLPLLPLHKAFDRTYTRSKAAAILFGQRFFSEKNMTDLPARPILILNATSLHSIRAWRFTREGLGDSRHGYARWGNTPLSVGECVAASAAFPPVFPPIRITRDDYSFSGPVYGEEPLKEYPIIPLTDGGVYDNLGIEVVLKPARLVGMAGQIAIGEFLVVSDGGYPPQYRFRSSGIPLLGEGLLLYRADEIAREQVSALRRRMLLSSFSEPSSPLKGLLVFIGSQIDRIPDEGAKRYFEYVSDAFRIPLPLVRRIQKIRTNLNRFTQIECEALMYHSYSMADAFLWAHRQGIPKAYQVPEIPSPEWKIQFSAEKVKEWEARF